MPSSFFLHQVIYWIAMMNVFLKHVEKTWEILAITEGHKLRLSYSCSECYLYNTAIITGPDVKSSIELNKLNQTEHSRHLFLLVCNPFLFGLNHNWFSFKNIIFFVSIYSSSMVELKSTYLCYNCEVDLLLVKVENFKADVLLFCYSS